MGRVDVDQMVSEMTPEEMDGWLAYHQLEPFGDAWYRNAVLCAPVVNANGASKQPMMPEEFMPQKAEAEPEPDDGGLSYVAARFGANS